MVLFNSSLHIWSPTSTIVTRSDIENRICFSFIPFPISLLNPPGNPFYLSFPNTPLPTTGYRHSWRSSFSQVVPYRRRENPVAFFLSFSPSIFSGSERNHTRMHTYIGPEFLVPSPTLSILSRSGFSYLIKPASSDNFLSPNASQPTAVIFTMLIYTYVYIRSTNPCIYVFVCLSYLDFTHFNLSFLEVYHWLFHWDFFLIVFSSILNVFFPLFYSLFWLAGFVEFLEFERRWKRDWNIKLMAIGICVGVIKLL